jgi:uncharacterized OB-fold protein
MTGPILPDTDDPETRGFWDAAREGRLVVQQCVDCGHLRFPPHPGCPECQGSAAVWHTVSGKAALWSYVVVHGPTLPVFQDKVPFPVAVVTLAEAPHLRMVGNLVAAPDAAINSVNPALLEIGMPLFVTFLRIEDVALPAWVVQ